MYFLAENNLYWAQNDHILMFLLDILLNLFFRNRPTLAGTRFEFAQNKGLNAPLQKIAKRGEIDEEKNC